MIIFRLSDAKIISGIQSKSEKRCDKVLQHIFWGRGWRKHVINWVIKNGGSKQDGEDIAQKTLIAFYDNIRNEKFNEESKLQKYFMGIARKTWYKHLQSQKNFDKKKDTLKKDTNQSVEDSFIQDEYKILFQSVLKQLGTKCEKALSLYMQDYSMEEIALELSLGSADSAKTTTFRCRMKLRELLTRKPNLKYLIIDK